MLLKVQILEHLLLKYQIAEFFARLVKLVDTSDLKSDSYKRVSVQVR